MGEPATLDRVTVHAPSVPILMVDDNAAKLFALRAVLEPLGFNIVEAESGVEALRCVMAQNFAVILLDVLMPLMDGFETAARIRQCEKAELTPIIFITAHTPDEVAHGDHYAEGAVDFIYAPIPPEELRAKVAAFAGLYTKAAGLASKALEMQSSAEQLAELNVELQTIARRDPLTGLRNRRALAEDLEGLEARVGRYGHRYCMALLDIDQFKPYNDTLGHQAGDDILQAVSVKLTELLRSGDSLYRFGGEEFLCIFTEQSLEAGSQAVERMREGIEALAIPHPASASGVLTVSGGVSILDADRMRSADQVLKEADEALYRAKRLGRNRVETADPTTSHQHGDTGRVVKEQLPSVVEGQGLADQYIAAEAAWQDASVDSSMHATTQLVVARNYLASIDAYVTDLNARGHVIPHWLDEVAATLRGMYGVDPDAIAP